MVRSLQSFLALCFVCLTSISISAQTVTGRIPGAFNVTLSGSSSYTIPVKVAPGTAGIEPNLSISYDSQAPSGPLGAGWSLTGISTITRGPKNARTDKTPAGVSMTESDALYLDGQRLLAISTSGSGSARRIEYRKEVDDQTQIVEVGADFGSAQFTVRTKGGIRIDFDSVSGAGAGENRGDIRFSDGSVLLRAESRAADSTGNFMDFYYVVNKSGNYDISKIRYTGHEGLNGDPKAEQSPYAEVDFSYESLPTSILSYVAGHDLVVDNRLKEIKAQVARKVSRTPNPTLIQVSRYDFDYTATETANRFVLTEVHEYGDDDSALPSTKFIYSPSVTRWAESKFTFPTVNTPHEEIAAGYRFAHISGTGDLPDVMYSAEFNGQLEGFAFHNSGTTWTSLDTFKPPVPFNGADGTDLGVILLDVNNDHETDILQSYQPANGPVVTNTYLADDKGWKLDTSYNLPFIVSKNGQSVATVLANRWSGGPGPDLLYKSQDQQGFLANTVSGWKPDTRYAPPFDLSNPVWLVDADCSGHTALLTVASSADGSRQWQLYRFGTNHWEPVTTTALLPPFTANVSPEAVRVISVDNTACQALLVASAEKGGIHGVYQASSTGWNVLSTKTPPFDFVDSAGVSNHAVVAKVSGTGMSDVFAHYRYPDGHEARFLYYQTSSGWQTATDPHTLPLLSGTGPEVPKYINVADFTGDGKADIVIPTNSRQSFGDIYVSDATGFSRVPNYTPPVAFANKDKSDQGARLVDLNGDGLLDILESKVDSGPPTAWLNNGAGWTPQTGLTPPVPFAGAKIAGNPVQFVDIDGDGYVDLLYSYKANNTTTTHLFRNISAGGGARKWSDASIDAAHLDGLIPPTQYPFAADAIGDLGVRFLDVTGTGRPYMLVGYQLSGAAVVLTAFSNDGTKWQAAPEYAPPLPFVAQIGSPTDPSHDLSIQLVDVNADGLPDFVAKYHDPNNPSQVVEGVWLNTGKGWSKDPSITVPVALDTLTWDNQSGLQVQKNASIQWTDLNGDGLPDIVYLRREGGNNEAVTYLGTGRGWAQHNEWQIPASALPDRSGDPGVRFVDVNGDGYPDLLYLRTAQDGTVEKGVLLNTGNGWQVAAGAVIPNLPLVDKDGNDLGVRLYDTQGIGLTDLVQVYSGDKSQVSVQLAQGARSDVLASVRTGDGILTEIYYQTLIQPKASDLGDGSLSVAPLAQWALFYDRGSDSLSYPFIAPVPSTYAVRRTVTTESPDRKYASSYRYGGYRMDGLAKSSLGFAWRDSLNETNAILSHTQLSQEVSYAGKTKAESVCFLNAASSAPVSQVPTDGCAKAQVAGFEWIRPLSSETFNWKVETLDVGGGLLPTLSMRQVSLSQGTSSTYELDGQLVESHIETYTYDETPSLLDRHLNLLSTNTAFGDGYTVQIDNAYESDDPSQWHLGRLSKSTVTKTKPQPAADQPLKAVHVASFTYDDTTGLLMSETANSGSIGHQVTTTYERDQYGNITKQSLHADGVQDHNPQEFTYDAVGRFAVTQSNALQQKTVFEHCATTGLLCKVTDPNGISSQFTFDGFGRPLTTATLSGAGTMLTTSVRRLSIKDLTSLDSEVPTSDLAADSAVLMQASDGQKVLPGSIKILDTQGRELRVITEGFRGKGKVRRLILRDTHYDLQGNPDRSSLPYEKGQPVQWITLSRDVMSRVVQRKDPAGGVTQTIFAGRKDGGTITTSLDAKKHKTVVVTDMHQLPIQVTDPRGGKLSFAYDAGGRPTSVKTPLGKTAVYQYDKFGRRSFVSDPDAGKWGFQYDSLGRLVAQTDEAKGGKTIKSLEYDALGRVQVERTSTDVWTTQFDTAPQGIGKIALVGDDAGKLKIRYSYDEVGRLQTTDKTVDGETFSFKSTYDSFGRTSRTEYPNGVAVENKYDDVGFLTEVDQAGTTHAYWTRNQADPFGNTTDSTLGNGVHDARSYDLSTMRPNTVSVRSPGEAIVSLSLRYDIEGNLLHRAERVQGHTEDFGYDNLDRLTSMTGADGSKTRYQFDADGRFMAKATASYKYADNQPGSGTVCNGQQAAAHAVLSVSDKSGSTSYRYDCHGNMIANGSDVYTYSADSRLLSTEVDPSLNFQRHIDFDYGPDGQRYREHIKHGLEVIDTLILGGYQRSTEMGEGLKASSVRFVRERCFLANSEGIFAVVENSKENFDYTDLPYHAGATHIGMTPVVRKKVWYLHKDQLGSILAITDESARVSAKYWYDPWGTRTGGPIDPSDVPSGDRLEESWNRGFVSQEHLDDYGLIHLNDRVYEPGLGQFVSVDPINQAPMDSQLWNPYMYGRDNPLRFSDPTGDCFVVCAIAHAVSSAVNAVGHVISQGVQAVGHAFAEAGKWIGQNWKTVVIVAAAVVVTVATAGTAAPALGTAILSGMAGGATAGALGSALYGGDVGDILTGAFKGAVIGGISGGALYGIGSLTAAGGALNDIEGIAGHGLVGGAQQAAQGGNFWQGFEAGALTKGSSLFGPSFDSGLANTARAAIVGGTAAELGGGNFANGAVTGAFSYALNDAMHPSPERDPYSLDDAFSGKGQINLTDSFGEGPKAFDIFGDTKYGATASNWGGGPSIGADWVYGENPSPSVGLSCPASLCSIGVGVSYSDYSFGVSGSVRVLPVEASYTWSVNLQRLYQGVESGITRWIGSSMIAPPGGLPAH